MTLIPPLFWLYDSKFWSSAYLVVLFAVSAWNGASFYRASRAGFASVLSYTRTC